MDHTSSGDMGLKQNDSKKRKIVFIVGALSNGGIERLVTEWCLYLKNITEWSPTVVCILKREGPFLKTLEENNIEVLECRLKNKSAKPFVLRMGKLIRTINPDVVHSQVAFSLLWQTMGFVLGGAKKIIYTQHNEYQNWNSFVAKSRLRFYYYCSKRFIDHYTSVSNKVRISLSGLLGISPDNFPVIYNAVNTDLFYPRKDLRLPAREQIGIKGNDFVIGMIARFAKQKGHQFMLEACAELSKEGVFNYKLVLIGNGDYQHLQKTADDLGICAHVMFLGNRTDVHILLQGFDCFVLPSLWEGLPLALIEAMSCELPVIASDVSGNAEVIETEKTGLLVRPGNSSELAKAIKKLYHDPGLARRLASNAHKMVVQKFNLTGSMASYLELYQ